MIQNPYHFNNETLNYDYDFWFLIYIPYENIIMITIQDIGSSLCTLGTYVFDPVNRKKNFYFNDSAQHMYLTYKLSLLYIKLNIKEVISKF